MLCSCYIHIFLIGITSGFASALENNFKSRLNLNQVQNLDLGQLNWFVSNQSGDKNITVQALVPGGIYSDLERAGVIDDLYYRFNDVEYAWVGQTDWTYRTEITFDENFLRHNSIQLDCKGLDTVSTVWMNGNLVGSTSNMFIRYIYDIKQFIDPGENSLEISFKSPVVYSQNRFEEQAKDHVVPPICVPEVFQGVCHANHIRKMQSSFSWDWGPAAPSSGIWRDINIVAFDTIRFKYVMWDVVDTSSSTFSLEVKAVFVAGLENALDVNIYFNLPAINLQGVERRTLSRTGEGEMEATLTIQIPKADVELWWPNGSGNQPLYDINFNITSADGLPVDQVSYPASLGFRTIELVQEKMEIEGTSFYFKVNGKPIFMKGSNWIPAHVLPEKVTREFIYDILYSAKESHMNMLRVWGGGIYEHDDFYQIADELGILIWQDFMFACSMYPADPDSLLSVRSEIRDSVRRLYNHPSVALWAANNENEVALRTNWYGTDSNFQVYKEDYIKLYVETVKSEVEKIDPSRPFLLSSPSNGLVDPEEGYIAENPYSSLKGDVHVYNYRDNSWDPSIYVIPRFCSEYGFQSFPSFEIMEPVSEVWDWSFPSAWFKHRQHHPGGNLELPWQIGLNLYIDLDSLDTIPGMMEFLYLAQVYQAVSLKTESEHYRRYRSTINSKGEGFTMGALYWQLNDIWPGASWTSLEHGGKWKMSHYFAYNFFSPTLVSPVIEGDMINVYVVCDQTDEREIKLTIRTKKWSFVDSYSETFFLGPVCSEEGAHVQYQSLLSDLLEKGDCKTGTYDSYRLKYCMVELELHAESQLVSQNHLFSPPRGLVGPGEDIGTGLQLPSLALRVLGTSNQLIEGPYVENYEVEVSTDNLALFVWVEAIGIKGRFSDNGFHLTSPTKIITFLAKEYTSVEELEQSLQIRAYKPY